MYDSESAYQHHDTEAAKWNSSLIYNYLYLWWWWHIRMSCLRYNNNTTWAHQMVFQADQEHLGHLFPTLSYPCMLHPSVHPLFSAYPGSGRSGSRLSEAVQTSLSPAMFLFSGFFLRGIPRPDEIYHLSSIFWVCPSVSGLAIPPGCFPFQVWLVGDLPSTDQYV